jgi:predicted ATPase/transcriptional regulator with XRE-family HTH domain
LRLQAGLSQEILAERAGISVASIAAYERNRRRRPYPHTLMALASALGLTSDEQAAFVDGTNRSVDESPSPSANVRLPKPPTTLIGRDAELVSAAGQLDPARAKVRLLTLRGPGGVGKTRLALAIADTLVDSYPDGVVFVDLSPLHDHRLVAATIAQALNVHESPGRSARELVLERLHQMQLLLVLDNFEHLLGAAPLIAELLANCSLLAVLITSRMPLRIRAEHRFSVGPLPLPKAVDLFVDRTHAANPTFELNDSNAPVIAAICRRLDGIPLAIELAAARVGLLGAQALLRRLERSFAVLGPGAADLPERQQTLRQTLDWSHALLEPRDRVVLRRLAVFTGGWTLEAAESVCVLDDDGQLQPEDILARLSTLVDAGLVQSSLAANGMPRFRMLETIREYAYERLVESGEARAVGRQHRHWALELVPPVTPSPPTTQFVGLLTAEADNLRSALRSAIDDAALEQGLWLAVGLSTLWYVRGAYAEGRACLTELLALPNVAEAPLARAHALAAAGHFATNQSDYAEADRHLAQAHTLAVELGHQLLVAVVTHFQANVARWRGDLPGARARYESALAIYRLEGQRVWEAAALAHLAFTLDEMGELDLAERYAKQSHVLAEATGNTWDASRALRVLGRIAAQRSDAARAQALHAASLGLGRELEDEHDAVLSMLAMAEDVHSASDPAAAWQLYWQCLQMAERVGNRLLSARSLDGLATLAASRAPEQAVRLAAAADALRASLGASSRPLERGRLHASMETARRELGARAFAAAWQTGSQFDAAKLLADTPPELV